MDSSSLYYKGSTDDFVIQSITTEEKDQFMDFSISKTLHEEVKSKSQNKNKSGTYIDTRHLRELMPVLVLFV